MIAIVDYGLGNLGSVANMLRKIGAAATITSDAGALREATALILPGVGHFDEGMKNLTQRGLRPVLDERVLGSKVPILGICLGMQLLTRGSEEGTEAGLGWIPADTKRFAFTEKLPVPHMGWNEVEVAKPELFGDVPSTPPRYYFVHSFHAVCDAEDDVAGWTTYGYRFAASLQHANVYGVQFHPEKSHKFGMALLKGFAKIVGDAA